VNRAITALGAGVAGGVLLLALVGCAPSVQSQAEANLQRQLDDVEKSFASAAPRVRSATELLQIGYIPDFSEYETDSNLSLDRTGWYKQEQNGKTGTIYVLGVGKAHGSEGLSYADAIVFRCVRMTVPFGSSHGKVTADKVSCPGALRKAANIAGSGPEV
jgi:hypothetical protein